MKREGKTSKKKGEDDLPMNFANSRKIMSSNLPLLFANGCPKSLDTISQPELEEFVPFMILCSLGERLDMKPKEISNLPTPEWWPQGFPFRFPLGEQNEWINRQVMLKSLVCRCYTFYDCEFLLKFSSELADTPPSQLHFKKDDKEKTTSIYDDNGAMLVKCRNENIYYDLHKNRRRYLSPAHRSPPLNQTTKKCEPAVIDLTFDSSEDEKEVYFKETPSASHKSSKRKGSFEVCQESVTKQRCIRRIFQDFPPEVPEPIQYNKIQTQCSERKTNSFSSLVPSQLTYAECLSANGSVVADAMLRHGISDAVSVEEVVCNDLPNPYFLEETFMEKLGLIPLGKEIIKEYMTVDRKKRLSYAFNVVNVTSKRGQDMLVRNKHSFNIEASLERNNRYTGTSNEENAENNQVCTRASLVLSAMYKDDQSKLYPEPVEDDNCGWCHTYKWPHRTSNPRYPHKGPSVKPCIVVLNILSEDAINFWTKRRRTLATMTPERWRGSKIPSCACQKIPLIILDDDLHSKFKNKSSSTRCSCIRSKLQYAPFPQVKQTSLELKTNTSSRETKMNSNSESSVKARHRSFHESQSRSSRGFNLTRSSSAYSTGHSFSYDKEGLSVICQNDTLFKNDLSFNFKRSFHRRPLAVVPPIPVMDKSLPKAFHLSFSCLLQNTPPLSSLKLNINRSISDAIKWYTKDDPISGSLDVSNQSFEKEKSTIVGSQENIKPSSELSLLKSKKVIYYFQKDINSTERDYCFQRSSDGTSKLVTRRGERHYINREPCPSCFQGRDTLCVYEFIRQAKLAGVTLHQNQKQLQLMFVKFIQAVDDQV